MCETLFWRLEPQPLAPIPHKYLYLWSDHRTKDVQWYYIVIKLLGENI